MPTINYAMKLVKDDLEILKCYRFRNTIECSVKTNNRLHKIYCMLDLKYEKTAEDIRGKTIFYSKGKIFFGFAETKKGFARGGHYRNTPQWLFIISGKVKYTEKNLDTNLEKIKNISAPCLIDVPPNTANLLIALEDSLMIETLPKEESPINYPEYRNIVKEKMTS